MDNALLMNNPLVKEEKKIKKILDMLSNSLGMTINLEKSLILFFNAPLITQRSISRILGFQAYTLPSKYPNAPLTKSTIKHSLWRDILNKLNYPLDSWTFQSLSIADRLVLLKLVLQSRPLYLFFVLVSP